MDNIPFIIIKLDTERKFRLSNKAFYIFEQVSGKTIHTIDFDAISITDVSRIIYSGLKSQDDSITLDAVIDLIDGHMTYENCMESIVAALEGSSFLHLKDSK
jgi:hypothetical protein